MEEPAVDPSGVEADAPHVSCLPRRHAFVIAHTHAYKCASQLLRRKWGKGVGTADGVVGRRGGEVQRFVRLAQAGGNAKAKEKKPAL